MPLWLLGISMRVFTGVIIFLFLAGVLPLTLMVRLLFPDISALYTPRMLLRGVSYITLSGGGPGRSLGCSCSSAPQPAAGRMCCIATRSS